VRNSGGNKQMEISGLKMKKDPISGIAGYSPINPKATNLVRNAAGSRSRGEIRGSDFRLTAEKIMKKESQFKDLTQTPLEKNYSRERINNSGLPPMSANMKSLAVNESKPKLQSAMGQFNNSNGLPLGSGQRSSSRGSMLNSNSNLDL
jgi:hypothetical protein